MARAKPIPPPNPSLPFFTIDTLIAILLRPLLSPTASFLPPLILLALRHPASSQPLLWSLAYTFGTLLLQLVSHYDRRIAGGQPRTLKWQDEVVLITGGAGGLGTCLAEVYAMRGVDVAVIDIMPEDELVAAGAHDGTGKGQRTRKEAWTDMGCTYYACDVGSRDVVDKLKERVEKDLGAPTILINAAAVTSFTPLLSTPASALATSISVNLLSHIHTIQTFAPAMLARPNGGTIVTISSVLGYLGCAGLADYTACKAALNTLHHSLTAEFDLRRAEKSGEGTVNTILATPGQLSTPLFARIVPPSSFMGPVVTPAALAALIVAAIDEGKDAEIAMPLYARVIGLWGALPAGVRRMMRGIVGLDRAGWDAVRGSGEEKRWE